MIDDTRERLAQCVTVRSLPFAPSPNIAHSPFAQQTREISIRVALGASSRDVSGVVVAHALRLALVGALIGLAGAAWGTKAIQSMLHGVARTDAASYVAGRLLATGIPRKSH